MAGDGAPGLYRDARVGRHDPTRPYPPGLGARPGVHTPAEFHRWRDYLRVLRPMERNQPINVDFLEALWHDVCLNELRRAPEEHPVLFVERAGLTRADRKALMQIAFETFSVPAYLPMTEAPLAMFASGRTTGLALCSGASATHVVPVYEGHALYHAATCFPLAGLHVTAALHRTLSPADRDLTVEAVQELKHMAACVSLDYEHDSVAPSIARHYVLPATPSGGARNVALQSADRMACAEILFQPSLAGLSVPGMPVAVQEAISKCDSELQPIMRDNIVLAGGNTMLPGFLDRLNLELRRLVPREGVRIISSPERDTMGWQGGSLLMTMPQSQHMWIEKGTYDENGPDRSLRLLH